MTSSQPAPLVDSYVDLRDFPFMPVEIIRLFGSEFHAVATDSEWRAGVTLWLKSFHQVPAGSISGTDKVIARLCEIDEATWRRVKKVVLRGWVKCSDGRWYHPVVCEKALEGWIEKLASQKLSAAGNAKQHNNQSYEAKTWDDQISHAKAALAKLNPRSRVLAKKQTKYQPTPLKPEPPPAQLPLDAPAGTPNGTPAGSAEGSQYKRNRNVNRREKDISLSEEHPQDVENERERDFARFAGEYPSDGLKLPDEARRALNARIDSGEPIDDIVAGAAAYREECRHEGRKGRYVKAAHSWLDGGGYKRTPKTGPPVAVHFPNKTWIKPSDPLWPALERRFRAKTPGRGPPPWEHGWYFPNEWIQEIRECVPS